MMTIDEALRVAEQSSPHPGELALDEAATVLAAAVRRARDPNFETVCLAIEKIAGVASTIAAGMLANTTSELRFAEIVTTSVDYAIAIGEEARARVVAHLEKKDGV